MVVSPFGLKVPLSVAEVVVTAVAARVTTVGGGGLIAGIASWYAGKIKVVGVEPEKAPMEMLAYGLDGMPPTGRQAHGIQRGVRTVAGVVVALQFQRQHNVLFRGQGRQEMERLEDESDQAPANGGAGLLIHRIQGLAIQAEQKAKGINTPYPTPIHRMIFPAPPTAAACPASPAPVTDESSCNLIFRP